jgi:hypothetical protein
MTTLLLIPAAGPVPADRRDPARTGLAGRIRGLAGALLRAALCASSVQDLDDCGVLRTAKAQSRRRG